MSGRPAPHRLTDRYDPSWVPRGRLAVVGHGWHGRTVLASLARLAERFPGSFEVIAAGSTGAEGVGDPAVGDLAGGRGRPGDPIDAVDAVVLGADDPDVRWADCRSAGDGPVACTVVDPTADIVGEALLGPGTTVGPYVHLGGLVRIGRCCVVGAAATIAHDSVLGDGVEIGAGAGLSGGVVAEDHVRVGANAVVVEGVRIGAGATVRAGAVVVRDVGPGEVVAGVPAAPVRPGRVGRARPTGPGVTTAHRMPAPSPPVGGDGPPAHTRRPEPVGWTADPSVLLDGGAVIGPGVFLGPLSVIGVQARIGAGVRADSCVIGAAATIGDGARIGALVVVGVGATVGSGAVIGAGSTIEAGALVPAGAVLAPRSVVDAYTGWAAVGEAT